MLSNIVRSSAFLASFVTIFRTCMCLHSSFLSSYPSPISAPAWTRSPRLYWLFGSLTGFSLIFDPDRAETLAMYCAPKAGESAWKVAVEWWTGAKTVGRKADKGRAYGGMLLAAVAMGVLVERWRFGGVQAERGGKREKEAEDDVKKRRKSKVGDVPALWGRMLDQILGPI